MFAFGILNRRRLLIGSAVGLSTSFSAAMTGQYGSALARKAHGHRLRRPHHHRDHGHHNDHHGERHEDHDPASVEQYRESYPGRPRRGQDPVLFWNETSLQLVALDHSIDAKDARAPGPCASARAVALAHVVMADAVAAAYPVEYESLYVHEAQNPAPQDPDAFVGGAVAWILEHIFNTPAHSQFIAGQRQRFLEDRDPTALRSWEAGLAFARNDVFTSQWDWETIRDATLKTPTPYVAPPRGHTVDPFNPDQGFYGVSWGRIPPLTPRFGNIVAYGPGDPPGEESREYQHDFREVLQLGAYREEPTPEQVRSGLFWAYDGARLIGTPVRSYNQVARKIAEDDDVSLPEMARLLALFNLALADACLVCWGAKYHYNVWRPVVAIRQSLQWRPAGAPRTNPTQFALGSDTRYRATAQNFMGASEGGGTASRPSLTVLPYKLAAFTPNFPSYPSGHATMAGACFGILKKVRAERERGDPDRINPHLVFVSDELNGLSIDNFTNRPRPYLPRSFSSIDRIIQDINRSRIYLGLHWNFDCERGAASGERVAKAVHEIAYRHRRRHPEVSDTGHDRFRAVARR